MRTELRPGVFAEFADPRDTRRWYGALLDRMRRVLRPTPADRLARALRVRAAAIEEVTVAWYAADCPPPEVE